MQQVKKQLQDAIKKLKSDWGINEVKREDLAAVLDKVVAALDRAAQLPVAPAPAGLDFDKHFFRVVVVDTGHYNNMGGKAPGGCYPALAVHTHGPMKAYMGFFELGTKNFYERDENDRTFDDLARGRLLYNRKAFMRAGTDSYGNNVINGVHGQVLGGDKEADDLDDPNWVF